MAKYDLFWNCVFIFNVFIFNVLKIYISITVVTIMLYTPYTHSPDALSIKEVYQYTSLLYKFSPASVSKTFPRLNF